MDFRKIYESTLREHIYNSNDIKQDSSKSTTRVWLRCNMIDETEICDLASAMTDVLVRACGYDEGELEEEWMQMSFDQDAMQPNLDGAEEWFNQYAEEVLETLWSLDESSYDIFNFVEKEETQKPNYGSGDDKYAAALF